MSIFRLPKSKFAKPGTRSTNHFRKARTGPRVHVRRNGSRYIDPEELLRSEKVKKTIEELKANKLTSNSGATE